MVKDIGSSSRRSTFNGGWVKYDGPDPDEDEELDSGTMTPHVQ